MLFSVVVVEPCCTGCLIRLLAPKKHGLAEGHLNHKMRSLELAKYMIASSRCR